MDEFPSLFLLPFLSILTFLTLNNLSNAMLQLALSQEAAKGRDVDDDDVDNPDEQPSCSGSASGPPAIKKMKKGPYGGVEEVTGVLKDHFTNLRQQQQKWAREVLVHFFPIYRHNCFYISFWQCILNITVCVSVTAERHLP